MTCITSDGFSVSWKITVAASSCGRKIPRNWPKTWLSGSRFRKRSGWKMALVLEVLADLAFQRLEVGENVSVRDDDAARLGRGAGGEDNLHDVVARERRRRDRRIGVRGEVFAKRFQMQGRRRRGI